MYVLLESLPCANVHKLNKIPCCYGRLILLYQCTGVVRRRCIGGDEWEEFNECIRVEVEMLADEV